MNVNLLTQAPSTTYSSMSNYPSTTTSTLKSIGNFHYLPETRTYDVRPSEDVFQGPMYFSSRRDLPFSYKNSTLFNPPVGGPPKNLGVYWCNLSPYFYTLVQFSLVNSLYLSHFGRSGLPTLLHTLLPLAQGLRCEGTRRVDDRQERTGRRLG